MDYGYGNLETMFFKKKKPETSKGTIQDLDYTLVRSSRRTLALQIKSGGQLVVRAPHRTPLREIEDWIYKKRTWILKHQHKSLKKAEETPEFLEGEAHPYLGETYPIFLKKGASMGGVLEAGEIILSLRGTPTPDKIERTLKAFYRAEAVLIFEDRLDKLFPPFQERGHKRPPISLRWMKGRWGSMSTSGKMSLNTQLVKKDIEHIDYVIVHELCHMEHMNHGKGFYNLMDQMMPGWKNLRKGLKGDL